MKEEKKQQARVMTRIPAELNEWLDKRSQETALTKSTIILMALDQYRQTAEAESQMQILEKLLEEVKALSPEQLNALKILGGEELE